MFFRLTKTLIDVLDMNSWIDTPQSTVPLLRNSNYFTTGIIVLKRSDFNVLFF